MARFQMPRSFYIPAGAMKVSDKRSDAVAYVYTNGAGHLAAVMFQGKADKPAQRYCYNNEGARAAAVVAFFERRQQIQGLQASRKAERKAKGRGVEVGDVLRRSWGYDQTNIDYYEVTALIGKTMVEIREIGRETVSTGDMTGKCVPMKGNYTSEPMRKIAKDGAVVVSSYGAHAFKVQAARVAGCDVFSADNYSTYA